MNQRKTIHFFAPKRTMLQVREDPPSSTPLLQDPAVKAAFDAAVATAAEALTATAVTGLKAKNEELLGKLRIGTEKLAAFGTLDPVKAAALLQAMDHDEDMKLFGEGKKAVVIDKYTERMRASHLSELEAANAKTTAESNRAETYRDAVLDNQIRSVTTDCHKGAVEDALLAARQIFKLDAKGVAVKLDSKGEPELGKDGKTLFSPAEWMEQQRELKPHWFPAAASGSGSGNASGAAGGAKSMKRSTFDGLTTIQQGAVARAGTQIVD